MSESSAVYRFGPYDLDARTGELRKSGVRIRLGGQPLEVLTLLIERQGELVTREELKDLLWKQQSFTDFDHGVNTAIQRIRRALGDSAQTPRFIETLPRKGYRLVPPVKQIDSGLAELASAQEDPGRPVGRVKERPVFAGVVLAGAAALTLAGVRLWPESEPEPVRRFNFALPVEVGSGSGNVTASISPDGRRIAYVEPGSQGRLWIQDLDREEPRAIEGSEGADGPFWSPDSSAVAFFTPTAGNIGAIRQVSANSGPTTTIAEMRCRYGGGAWSPHRDTVVLACRPHLYAVSVNGGEPRVLLAVDDFDDLHAEVLRSPRFLPSESGGRILLFSAPAQRGPIKMIVQDLDNGYREEVGEGIMAAYSPSGHILHNRSDLVDELWALPFSLDQLRATGEAFRVAVGSRGATVADDDTLVYVDGLGTGRRQFVRLDRGGNEIGVVGESVFAPRHLNLSPDGNAIAAEATIMSDQDVFVWDVASGASTRLPAPYSETVNTWSPTGTDIAFASQRDGVYTTRVRKADGSGDVESFLEPAPKGVPSDWSGDGRFVLVTRRHPDTGLDLWCLERTGSDGRWEEHPFLQGPLNEQMGKFSPDARYLVYSSDESGQREVYVRAFPSGEERQKLSIKGGNQPRWSRDGKELFYLEGGTLVSVPVSTKPRLSLGKRTEMFEMFELPYLELGLMFPQYDVSPYREWFVKIQPVDRQAEAGEPRIRIVENWYEEFRASPGN